MVSHRLTRTGFDVFVNGELPLAFYAPNLVLLRWNLAGLINE